MAWELVRFFTEYALGRGSRSSIVTTLLIMSGLLGTATLVCAVEHAPDWLVVYFAALLAIDFAAFLVAYGYFAYKSPDALRSERFFLQKMAIQHGLVGDSVSGVLPADQILPLPSAADDPSKQIESHL